MPSGSHGGGGGGSHFGGGSSGGSHFGGGSYGSNRPSSPIRFYFFGHHYYVSSANSSKISSMFTVAIFIIMFLIFSVFALVSNNKNINKIVVDREYYLQMIENAENDNDYKKLGVVTDKFYNEDCNKWYFTYSLTTDDGGTLRGYTFSVYTFDEISQYNVGDTLEFAVNSKVVTPETDSINMGYKNIPLENDGEYVNCLKTKKTSIVCISILSIVLTIMVIVIVREIKKYAVKATPGQGNIEDLKPGETFCEYCGSVIPKGNAKCVNCGSSRTNSNKS